MIKSISQIDADRLLAAAEPTLHAIGNTMLKAVRAEYDHSGGHIALRTKASDSFIELMTDAMLAAHLSGRLRTMLNAARRESRHRMGFGLYDSAVAFAQRRVEMPDDKIDDLRRQYGAAALNVMAENVDPEFEDAAEAAIADIVREGMHVREARSYLGERLEAAGLSGVSPYLLNTLVRTQIQIAYSAGQWNALQDPEIQNELWGYEYVTARDDRVRPEHAALDGTKLPKDDGFWLSYWPPNGYNCRCIAVEIWNDESDAMKTIQRPPDEIDIPEDWLFNAGRVFKEAA
jgi:SPP1 gp7 family putative phage head morphogenesis protein